MKNNYVKPVMVVEQFLADEYISACDDKVNKYYFFRCDAGGGNWADIYEGTYPNGENLTPGSKYFHACGKTHYVKANNAEFLDGWYDEDQGSGVDYKFDVVIWKGEYNNNVHATRALRENINIVEGNKS